MSASPEQVAAGQAVYTPRSLRLYDWLVLGISNRLIWKCPTRDLLRLYDDHVSANHLDVGVGTGYFLDKCRFPVAAPRVALLDLNPACLQAAAKRIGRYAPEVQQANVLEPLSIAGPLFDSVGINYLLHCLPGTLATKAVVFEHAAALLNPAGVLFGSTILGRGVRRNWAARRLMGFYNQRRIFSNTDDDPETLQQALDAHFIDTSITMCGCVALFMGRKAGSDVGAAGSGR